MFPEILLLRAILKRTRYNTYRSALVTDHLKRNHPELWRVYQVLDLLMKDAPTQEEFAPSDLEAYFWLQYPAMKAGEKDVYKDVFKQVSEAVTTDEVTNAILKQVQARATATRLSLTAFDVAEGSKGWQVLVDEVSAFQAEQESRVQAIAPVVPDLDQLLSTTIEKPGLRWRLPSLNRRLGSLRKGDFGVVFARPETGKTTFLASEATDMAAQAKAQSMGPVLWINNEEQGSKVLLRCYQSALGLTMAALMDERIQVQKTYSAQVGDGLRLYDFDSVSKGDVEALCAAHSPSLLIFDQLDKVTGFSADRTDLELGVIYGWARQLAKKYCPVIGVCQADGSAEGVKWLSMANVSNAKTSKQAEADWILGIGKVLDPGYDYVRFMHLSKNKLMGDSDTDPRLRHDRWEVIIKPEHARYEDIGK